MFDTTYTWIDTPEALADMAEAVGQHDWMGFDTEFIGEKRFLPLLCLVQISSPAGNFAIDSLAITDLRPLFDLLENPAIVKLTHAGENDYQIVFHSANRLPRNVFDTQIAAGFLGYGYPVSFQNLVRQELGTNLQKSQTVTDWAVRPMPARQLQYAIEDVAPLPQLYAKMRQRLEAEGKWEWVRDECRPLEKAERYEARPEREALNSKLMQQLDLRGQAFLIRLFRWRHEEARAANKSREQILAKRLVQVIVPAMASGKSTLSNDRRISGDVVNRHWKAWNELYQQPLSAEEKAQLAELNEWAKLDPEQELLLELMHLIVKYVCSQKGIAPDLFLPRGEIRRMHADAQYYPPMLEEGWRQNLLGPVMKDWLRRREALSVYFEGSRCVLEMAATK